MGETLDLREVVRLMSEFEVEFLTPRGEFIFDYETNTFADISQCKDVEDVETTVILALCRPIGKGLKVSEANTLLKNINDYFYSNLTRDDMHTIYAKLCDRDKFEDLKSFVKRGFPMHELKNTLL